MTTTLALLVLFAAGTTTAAPRPVAPKSGSALCVLAPDDFKAAGVSGAGKPNANVSDPASAYCVYAGKSGATGGIELDVFDPAGDSEVDAKEAERIAMGEGGLSKPEELKLTGTDSAHWGLAKSGGPELASLCVRRGMLVFTLSVPASKDAKAQLHKLAGLVLERLAK